MAKAKYKIAKFNLYPADEPTGMAVGFSVKHKGREAYQDTVIPLAACEGLTEEEIADLAFENVRAGLEARAAVFETKGEILGSDYIPKPKPEAEPDA